ncbi:MAG: superoxide dismutase family protein [Cyanophyceae cyanobacterium]
MQFSQGKRLIKLTALGAAVTAAVLSTATASFSLSALANLMPSLQALTPAEIGYAVIEGTSDPELSGEVLLYETSAGLRVIGNLINTPPGVHGFHIHEFGSCADQGKAAGGHYNPDGVEHGDLLADGFEHAHAGDLGNVEVSEDGTAVWEQLFPGLTLRSGNYPVAGRSFILHAAPDDLSQPTGNAGARIGCGTIRATVSP